MASIRIQIEIDNSKRTFAQKTLINNHLESYARKILSTGKISILKDLISQEGIQINDNELHFTVELKHD
jgi:hypothetical protein